VPSRQYRTCQALWVRGNNHRKLAIALLPAALIAPLVSSPLRGLTHVPGCHIQPGEPVTIAANGPGSSQASDIAASAISLESPEDVGEVACPGIELLVNVTADSSGRALVRIPVNNNTTNQVAVTAEVHVGQKIHVVPIGKIAPGTAKAKFLTLAKSSRETSVSVGLFVGPG
jgi:hypothetical protein